VGAHDVTLPAELTALRRDGEIGVSSHLGAFLWLTERSRQMMWIKCQIGCQIG
jgi:hypothetical protein